jgi:monomeric sarcosine oxidase
MERYDVIVLGMGGVGSAALLQLARRGVRALGIDQFDPPHDRGSSHGQTRVIRQAYFEHPDYVPLLMESYRLWHDLEALSVRRLFHQVGLVQVGPMEGHVVPGVLRSAREHALAVKELSAQDSQRRWPGLRVPTDMLCVYEPAAGYLLVEDCVRAALDVASSAGADLLPNTQVRSWSADGTGVSVHSDRGDFATKQLIIAAGPWAASLLAGVNVKLVVRRKSLFWFEASGSAYDASAGFPVFLYELPSGVFYGFPKIDSRGVKAAEHSGGHEIDDPLAVDRGIDTAESRRVANFLSACLPHVSSNVTDHSVCLYTMSPDEHFIVDRHPNHPNVVFAAGLSGHGFKFTPVLGRALAELALDGGTELPIDFLSLDRFEAAS